MIKTYETNTNQCFFNRHCKSNRYFLAQTRALLHDIERDVEKDDFRQTATHCGIISCDLDDLDDLKDRIWEYENGLPKEAALICSDLDKTHVAD